MKEDKNDALQKTGKSTRSGNGFLWMLCSAIFWGILIGFSINLFLMFGKGYTQLMLDLQNTYNQQVSMLVLRSQDAASLYVAGVDVFYNKSIEAWLYIKKILIQIPYVNYAMSSNIAQEATKEALNAINQIFSVFGATVKVVMAKFISLLASFWVFIFASIVGAMDGLLTRYVRTIEGGRESTFIFHRVSDTVIKMPLGIMFLYLASPFFINPEMVAVIMSVLIFGFFYITTANLKKFL